MARKRLKKALGWRLIMAGNPELRDQRNQKSDLSLICSMSRLADALFASARAYMPPMAKCVTASSSGGSVSAMRSIVG